MDECESINTELKKYGIRIKRLRPFKGYRKLYAVIDSIARKWDSYSEDDRDKISKLMCGEKDGANLRFNGYMDRYSE